MKFCVCAFSHLFRLCVSANMLFVFQTRTDAFLLLPHLPLFSCLIFCLTFLSACLTVGFISNIYLPTDPQGCSLNQDLLPEGKVCRGGCYTVHTHTGGANAKQSRHYQINFEWHFKLSFHKFGRDTNIKTARLSLTFLNK